MNLYIHLNFQYVSIAMAWLAIGAIITTVHHCVTSEKNRMGPLATIGVILLWPIYLAVIIFGLICVVLTH